MSREVRRFTDLEVWRKAHQLFIDLYSDVKSLRRETSADTLAAQVVRSVGSISTNIAEGFNRSQKRFVNSLDIALGEANETESRLYKLRDAEVIDPTVARTRLKTIIEVQRMLTSLKGKIAANPHSMHESPASYETETTVDPFLTLDD